MDGNQILPMFQGSIDFLKIGIDAIVRLYQQMDQDMYLKCSAKRWRHFIPTDFPVSKLKTYVATITAVK